MTWSQTHPPLVRLALLVRHVRLAGDHIGPRRRNAISRRRSTTVSGALHCRSPRCCSLFPHYVQSRLIFSRLRSRELFAIAQPAKGCRSAPRECVICNLHAVSRCCFACCHRACTTTSHSISCCRVARPCSTFLSVARWRDRGGRDTFFPKCCSHPQCTFFGSKDPAHEYCIILLATHDAVSGTCGFSPWRTMSRRTFRDCSPQHGALVTAAAGLWLPVFGLVAVLTPPRRSCFPFRSVWVHGLNDASWALGPRYNTAFVHLPSGV